MRVKKFTIENYKACRGKKEFTPDGASFFLLGGNGQGKTSAGHALIDLLTKNLPSQPITEGENAGFIEFEFDTGAKVLGRFVDGKKPQIEFITPEGYTVGSPKELFAKLTGDGMDFSIDDMLRMQPKILREKLEKIAGLDLTELDQKESALVETRKETKIKLRDQLGRLQEFDESLLYADVKSAKELSDNLNELVNACHAYEDQERIVGIAHASVTNIEIQIEKLKSELKKAKTKAAGEDASLKLLHQPTDEEIATIKSELQTVEETNKKIAEAVRLNDEKQAYYVLEQKVAGLEEQVKAVRAEKETVIQSSPLPAEGLTFNEDGVLLIDGLPFEDNQIAHSRKVIAGIQIATSMLGDVKYLHFDGSSLDKENADMVLEYAEANGLQLCIERPLWEGGELKFEVHDKTSES